MAAHAGALMQESHHATLRGSAWAVMGSVGLCAQAHGMQECLPAFPSLATVGLAHITNKNSNSNSAAGTGMPVVGNCRHLVSTDGVCYHFVSTDDGLTSGSHNGMHRIQCDFVASVSFQF